MIINILIYGLLQFLISQIVHIIIWRIFSPKAYPIWLPVIFTLTPVGLFISLHILIFSGLTGIVLNKVLYLTIGSSFVMHLALSSMYIHMSPGIVFFSPSLELIKLLAEHGGDGLSAEEMDLPVLSEANTVGMRIKHLISSGMIQEESSSYVLTPKGMLVARSFYIYRRMLGLPGIGRG